MSEPTVLAVIDLGSNTFHLKVVRWEATTATFTLLFRERVYVKLAADGIETLGQSRYEFGIETLRRFRAKMDELKVVDYRAIGTAALRTASNGPAFVEEARERAGIEISLIPGSEEARLITQGVLLALPPLRATERVLIMDIGGGSVEFIIAEAKGTRWAQSFPVGVAVLKRKFHHSEPIAADEVEELEAWLMQELSPLWSALEQFPTDHLVGAAGTFDVIADLMAKERPTPNSHRIDPTNLTAYAQLCINATLEERLKIEGLPEQRADLIAVAFLLVQLVRKRAGIEQITVSDYSMKEGILAEMVG